MLTVSKACCSVALVDSFTPSPSALGRAPAQLEANAWAAFLAGWKKLNASFFQRGLHLPERGRGTSKLRRKL